MAAKQWLRCATACLSALGVIVFMSPVAAQPQEPILTVETGMHTGMLRRLAVDKSERFLVTVGEDKTARIWDISKGEGPVLERVLRPPIAPGEEGRLLAVAISPDGKTIACAGHGVTDQSGVFYFLPVEGDLERLKRTGVSQADIATTVASIAGKVIVFMDACHSGKVMEKVKRRSALDLSAVVNELASAENGAVVFSSATGRQYSLESRDWGNGAFAKALVEGIEGKADFRGTGRITVNMLDLYVSERVKELTKGQQTPCTVKPPNVPDFPVVVVRKVASRS